MKFKEVTQESNEVISVVNNNDDSIDTKVYSNNDTCIIYSTDYRVQHLSISNPKRKVKDSEINYALFRIMKAKLEDVHIFMTRTGVIHMHKRLV
ncbi:DUF1827 family protein [Niallia taxi]|uniref:DUF1827 family protein n=1 Tax=Niallia taxi TaxID=2499688 RepID=UPI00317A0112